MQPYNQRLTIFTSRAAMLLALLLLAGLQNVRGQAQSNPLYQEPQQAATNPLHTRAAGQDADGGPLRVEGSMHIATTSTPTLSLQVSPAGDDLVLRKRPGRGAQSTVRLEKSATPRAATATDYNSSRSNKRGMRSSSGSSSAAAQDYNSSRSNRGIMADTPDESPTEVTLVSTTTPASYTTTVDDKGAFVFAEVVPGAYQVCVRAAGRDAYCGHVTVLK